MSKTLFHYTPVFSAVMHPCATASSRRSSERFAVRLVRQVAAWNDETVQYLNSKKMFRIGVPIKHFLDFFADSCQKVSEFDTQEFWAQVLAAKIQRPDELSLPGL